MSINPVSGIGRNNVVNDTTSVSQSGSEAINMNVPQSKEQLETDRRLEIAKRHFEDLKYEGKMADYSRLANVRQDTNVSEIQDDGSVVFTFKGYTKGGINVNDFKDAYGIKDGHLRPYLKARHLQAVKDGKVVVEKMIWNGKEITPNEYVENLKKQGFEIDADFSVEKAMVSTMKKFIDNENDIRLVYSDGYIRTIHHKDNDDDFGIYSNMKLDKNDEILLMADDLKRK